MIFNGNLTGHFSQAWGAYQYDELLSYNCDYLMFVSGTVRLMKNQVHDTIREILVAVMTDIGTAEDNILYKKVTSEQIEAAIDKLERHI